MTLNSNKNSISLLYGEHEAQIEVPVKSFVRGAAPGWGQAQFIHWLKLNERSSLSENKLNFVDIFAFYLIKTKYQWKIVQ